MDDGVSWATADLGDAVSAYAWRSWRYAWDATTPGEYELSLRATDGAGNVQPTEQNWNCEGVQNNCTQSVSVVVTASEHVVQLSADKQT